MHPSMERASTSVKRVGNIPIVTSIKAFGKAEKSEKHGQKEQQWNMPSKIAAKNQEDEFELLPKEGNRANKAPRTSIVKDKQMCV